MKLGIYIGSFNPPHKGHIKVAQYLLEKKYVDKVLIIATPAYWVKQNLASIEDRINMLKYYETKNIVIESKNNHYIYTYELMRALKKEYPKDDLYLIMGADNIINFKDWKNYEELLSYKIIIVNRNNIDINKYIKSNDNFIVVDNFPFINISSSEIRKNLNSKYLSKSVLEYIVKNNLYGR